MNRHIRTFFIGCCVSLFVAPHVSAAVVINEIFPKASDAKFAWVELYNSGDQSVSLDRWRIENAAGASFILNASAIISPRGFLTFYQSQTGITFSVEGDTVKLIDEKNTLLDTQSYPGILGYNTSMGRSVDGGAGWTICMPAPEYTATPNKPNKCPAPTPTPTALPSPTFFPSPTPAVAIVNSPTPTMDPTSRFAYPKVLGQATSATPTESPTPTRIPDLREEDAYKILWTVSLIAGVSVGILIIAGGMLRSIKKP